METLLTALLHQLFLEQEAERHRLAKDLHDDLGQQIAALSIVASTIRRRLLPTELTTREGLDQLHQRIRTLAETARGLSDQMYPAVLEHAGLAAAMRQYCAGFSAPGGTLAVCHGAEQLGDVPAGIAICLYRILQEILQAAIPDHSTAPVSVNLERSGEGIRLLVTHAALKPVEVPGDPSAGLWFARIQARADMFGGAVRLKNLGGTSIEVSIPLIPG